jgi:hypothetical protein
MFGAQYEKDRKYNSVKVAHMFVLRYAVKFRRCTDSVNMC